MIRSTFTFSILASCQLILQSPALLAADTNWYAEGLRAELAGDYESALLSYEKAASSGLSDASLALGRVHRLTGDHESSLKWFLSAANAANKFAQYEVGLIYLHGSSATNADPDKATNWFGHAANAGHAEASYEMFKLERDVIWLINAAELGDPGAMQDLARAYERGYYGLEIDIDASTRWSRRHSESLE